MSREREKLLDEIELSLYTLTEDNLRYLCERIGIGGKDGSEVKGKSQRSLRRIIGEYCENVNLMESDEQGMSRLCQLKEDIKGIEEAARGVPTSPSQSVTAEVDSSQAGCDGEQNEEGGAWLPNNRQLADAAPEWLIIPEPRESLDPDCDSGTQSVQQEATVLLEDCRFMLGRRFNVKVEEQEEMISVFANEGEGPEYSDSSVHTLSTPGEKHQEVDKAERSHRSPQRKDRSTSRSQPELHLLTHSGETSPHCSGSKESLSSVRSYQCPECKKIFSSNAGLQKHLQLHGGKRLFQCSQCDKSFINNKNLYQHLPMHSGEKPHHCSDCGQTFSTARYLTKHKRIHSGIKPFCCPHCDKRYTRSDQLKVHIMTHTGERPYQCGQCEKSFKMKSHLKDHLLLHEVKMSHHCPDCDQRFSAEETLKEHMQLHTGEKPFHCLQCEKRYSTSDELKEHMMSHTEEQPDSENRSPSSRNVGEQCQETAHTVDKPDVSSDCGTYFAQQDHLAEHQQTHTGVKPHYCPEFAKRLHCSSHLKEHLCLHTREKPDHFSDGDERISSSIKPFHCEHCVKKFTRSDLLKFHIMSHTGEKPYQCPECD